MLDSCQVSRFKMLTVLTWIIVTNMPFGICAICSSGEIFGINDDKITGHSHTELYDSGTACTSGTIFGVNDNKVTGHSHTEYYDSGTGNAHMLGDSDHVIDCCGVVTQWQARVGRSGTIHFQIWRRTGTADEYELVGENEYTVSSSEATSGALVGPTSIAASSQISIKNDDRLGWWSSGVDQIWYWDEHTNDLNLKLGLSRSTLDSGSPISWSSANNYGSRRYTLQLTVGPNTSPSFTNIPDSSTSISETTSTDTSVYTVSATDSNPSDISTLSVSMTTNTYFKFNTANKRVKVKSSLVGAPNTVNLDFTVTDQCGNTASSTLTIAITYVPPTIHNLPSSASISEGITSKTLLYTLNVTDPTDFINCDLATTGVPFNVEQIGSTTDWGIYLKNNPTLDYASQNNYTLTIECDDTKDTVSGTFDVNVTPNAAPTILNLANATSASTLSTTGSVVFEVLATDPENEQLSFNMTCDPSPCPFTISTSGIITDTNLTDHIIPQYELSVYVYDGTNLVGPQILMINITDINHYPAINNMPSGTTVSLAENSDIGTSLFAVNATDEDGSDTLMYSMTSSPVEGLNYFTINSTTGLISLNNSTDFETMPATNFTLTIIVTDGNKTSTATIEIVITDQNEAPSLNQTSYNVIGTEGSAGTALSQAGFSITDDTGDTYNFSLSCDPENSYFVIDPNNGTILYASDYDLDDGSRPTNVTCNVTVTDSGGLIDTASLTITISAVNDNCPVFSSESYSFSVNYDATVGTTLGSVSATDADTGVDGKFTFNLDQSHLQNTSFNITSTGEIFVAESLSANYSAGITFEINVTAIDTGTCYDVVTVNITVIPLETTTERFRTFIEDEKNIAWLIACGVTLAALVAVLIHWARHPTVCKTLFGFSRKKKLFEDENKQCELIRTSTTETANTDSLKTTNAGRWPLNGTIIGSGRGWLTNHGDSMSSALNGEGKREWIPSPIMFDKGGERQWIPSPYMMNKITTKLPPSPVMSVDLFSEEGERGWLTSPASGSSTSSPHVVASCFSKRTSGDLFRFWDRNV